MGQWCSSAGLDPEATLPLDQGRAPPAVPLLSGALAAPLVIAGVQEDKDGVSHGEGSLLPTGPWVAL